MAWLRGWGDFGKLRRKRRRPAGDERGAIVAECKLCEHVDGHTYKDSNVTAFINTEDVLDAVTYRPLGHGMIRVIKPFAATR